MFIKTTTAGKNLTDTPEFQEVNLTKKARQLKSRDNISSLKKIFLAVRF